MPVLVYFWKVGAITTSVYVYRHFAFAREQRNGAHLAQIHADRVVGLVERAWSEIQFRLVARSVTIEVLVAAVRLVGIHDLDACGAKGIEEVIEFLGRGDFGRQNLVDLVVEQVALLLADSDQLAYFVVFSSIDKISPPISRVPV